MRYRACGMMVLTAVLGTSSVHAGSHLWRFNELYSNADGTVQFIELKECCGAANETALTGKWILSTETGNQYTFPSSLVPPTSNRYLLLATAGFAELPGAPTPDFIMPDSFFDLEADHLEYWLYSAAVITYGPGQLPLDGVHALQIDGSSAVNSPTNYAGESGSVVFPCHPADFDVNGAVDFGDLLAVLANWGPCVACPQDLDGDDVVAFADLLAVLSAWGPCVDSP